MSSDYDLSRQPYAACIRLQAVSLACKVAKAWQPDAPDFQINTEISRALEPAISAILSAGYKIVPESESA